MREMFWVMIEGSEKTVAMTEDKKVAMWIADNYPIKCVIRSAFVM